MLRFICKKSYGKENEMMMIFFLIEEFRCRLLYPMSRLLGVGKLSLITLSLFLRGFLLFFSLRKRQYAVLFREQR